MIYFFIQRTITFNRIKIFIGASFSMGEKSNYWGCWRLVGVKLSSWGVRLLYLSQLFCTHSYDLYCCYRCRSSRFIASFIEITSVKIVGFDIEWRPALSNNNKEANKTSMTRETSVDVHSPDACCLTLGKKWHRRGCNQFVDGKLLS